MRDETVKASGGHIVEGFNYPVKGFGFCSIVHQWQFKVCQEGKIGNEILALNLL